MTAAAPSVNGLARLVRFLSVLRHQQVVFLAVGILLLWATEPLFYLASLHTFSIGRTCAAVFFCAGHLFEVGFVQSYRRSAAKAPLHVAQALLARESWRFSALALDVIGTSLTLTGCALLVRAGLVPVDASNYKAQTLVLEWTSNCYFGGGLAFFTAGTVLWCQDYVYTYRELAQVNGQPPPVEKGGIYSTYLALQVGIAMLTLGVFLLVAIPDGPAALVAVIILVAGALVFTYASLRQVYVLWQDFLVTDTGDYGECSFLLPCFDTRRS
jgi:hypothetical protein